MKLINLMLLTIVWAFPKSMAPKHTVQRKLTVDHKQLIMNHLMAKEEILQEMNFAMFIQKYIAYRRPTTTRIVYSLF